MQRSIIERNFFERKTMMIKTRIASIIAVLVGNLLASFSAHAGDAPKHLRPPAVPLIAHDPYFSVWSFGDTLAGDLPRHWTGRIHALTGMVRIDGSPYRLMGTKPESVPAMKQISLRVLPTRTIYEFEAAGVRLTLTFTTPTLPDDLDILSRPVTYLTWDARSIDGKTHEASVYYDNSAELVVDQPDQEVVWSRPEIKGLTVMKLGTKAQAVLKKSGDDRRIDWGYEYLAVPEPSCAGSTIAADVVARAAFVQSGKLPKKDDDRMPRAANQDWPVVACSLDLGKIGAETVSRHILIAYDDEYSIEFLGTKLRPYWRRNGMEAAELLQTAEKQYAELCKRCKEFDDSLMADLTKAGGAEYADLCALAYRQAFAGHKLVMSPKGQPMIFSKENFSNGCIATVDVIYPAAPIFMLLSNELLKASVTPEFEYAATPRWKFPFAPHDIGTYPLANGQAYGGGEKTEEDQMPVEESGNMLIIALAISQLDGDTKYVEQYWPQISQWAKFLKENGLDPENQLCTDDFAGHLAHNANLSMKAIVALASYAELCKMSGRNDEAAEYRKLAEGFAVDWVKMAGEGDHFQLAFGEKNSWSQKYNLVWDKLLNLKLFPSEIAKKEIAFYKTKLNEFGLPLDSRKGYTKLDWQVWTATMADNRADFDALMKPVYHFVDRTPERIPLVDWYETEDATHHYFRARTVVGGLFIKALEDRELVKKWNKK
jgi:hypothetical protein